VTIVSRFRAGVASIALMALVTSLTGASAAATQLTGSAKSSAHVGCSRDARDFLYVGDVGNNTVERYDAVTGRCPTVFVGSPAGGLAGPTGLVFYHGPSRSPTRMSTCPLTGK
jgi:hypothetical protein